MAANVEKERKQASDLQKGLETLLGLQRLGFLAPPAADEIRNLVAEGIADKLGDSYRTFPSAHEGTEIRRDAVPEPCALKKNVEKFVAAKHAPPKTSKPAEQKPNIAQAITKRQRQTFNTLAQIKAQDQSRPNVNYTARDAARYKKTEPRKKAEPRKAEPKKQIRTTAPNPPTLPKDATSQEWTGELKAWDDILSKKAGVSETTVRPSHQQEPIAEGDGSLMAHATPKGNNDLVIGEKTAASPTPKDGSYALKKAATAKNPDEDNKEATASQSLKTAAAVSDKASDQNNTIKQSAEPQSSSDKGSIDFGDDLISFSY
ncbi:hypothetical protein N8I77_010526 [Diaporthe amygdali]|uniref:Uncharacterized protein n=1 Tax=Phomopsis amygdali TaxID=1214568 RepID=A0AAD9S8M7_PHOAM|nr:hypothetical protein N8I77_010526 [Diaporthe amygdali]